MQKNINAIMTYYLKKLAMELALFLKQTLPQRHAKLLDSLELIGLLQMVTQNWGQIAGRKEWPFEIRVLFLEMQNVRKRWCGQVVCPASSPDDVYRDFDTLVRVARTISASDAFIGELTAAKAAVISGQKVPAPASGFELKPSPEDVQEALSVVGPGDEEQEEVFSADESFYQHHERMKKDLSSNQKNSFCRCCKKALFTFLALFFLFAAISYANAYSKANELRKDMDIQTTTFIAHPVFYINNEIKPSWCFSGKEKTPENSKKRQVNVCISVSGDLVTMRINK